MERIREVIVVEGKYDIIRLKSVVDATVVKTAGFGIFKDKERLQLLRLLAEKRGLLILTDSDSAGFVIRNYLTGSIPGDRVKHAYVPEIFGKERRKTAWSKEGLLGVEGIDKQAILEALRRAGATFEGETHQQFGCDLTVSDLYELGLTGTPDSAQKRALLLKKMEFPSKLSTKKMLEMLNIAVEKPVFLTALQEIEKEM